MKIIISNNPLVKAHNNQIIYLDQEDYLDVLTKTRDYIHKNYHLLTHPLSSNFLADKTLYKTVVLKEEKHLDLTSLEIIEDAIHRAKHSLKHRDMRIFEPEILKDLQYIDYQIIKNTL